MEESWAKIPGQAGKASVDLHLDLPGPHGSRVRLGLETALRDAVRTGRLGPGMRLPSSRALAADLGIARNTVAEVYSQLVAEGWLTARTGAGTTVAERRAADPGLVEFVGRGSVQVRHRAGEIRGEGVEVQPGRYLRRFARHCHDTDATAVSGPR